MQLMHLRPLYATLQPVKAGTLQTSCHPHSSVHDEVTSTLAHKQPLPLTALHQLHTSYWAVQNQA